MIKCLNLALDEDYHEELTRNVLQSMRHGCSAGQTLFPLVILAVKDRSSAVSAMQKYRTSVPLNMFLPWVTQLISYVHHSPAIHQLLVDISREYPTHVRLPLAITRQLLDQEILSSKTGQFRSLSLARGPH